MGLFFFNVTALALLCGLEAVPAALYPRRRYLNRKALLALGFSYLCFLAMFRGAACGNDTENATCGTPFSTPASSRFSRR